MSHSSVSRQRPSKTVLYLCQSGHVLCENCHVKKGRHDNGDCSECHPKKNSKTSLTNAKKSLMEIHHKDLASGDCTKKPGTDDDTNMDKQKKKQKNKINVEEKNKIHNINQYKELTEIKKPKENNTSSGIISYYPIVQRPITCPVCSKMIALNSVLQHFFFDHSKIPRITLKYSTTFHTTIKVSDLGMNPDCMTVFTLVNKKRYSDVDKIKTEETHFLEDNGLYMKGPLLLMAAKFSANSSKKLIYNIKSNEETKACSAQDTTVSEQLTTESDLVVWLCKTIDDEIVYNLSISREDKKLSFSFTGDATHIKEVQNVSNIITKYECLTIKGIVANKMVNSYGQVHIYITVLV